MSFREWEYWPNGDMVEKLAAYSCDGCQKYIAPNWFRATSEGKDYCSECGFFAGVVPPEDYLFDRGYFPGDYRLAVHNGKILVVKGNRKFSWERKKQNQRKDKEYSEWRTAVFIRDNYTCVACHKKGGSLQAHHIKSFINYPDLRLELDNGETLCARCHKEKHRVKNG